MQNQKLIKKVETLISEVLNIDKLPSNASQENTSGWDSIAYLSIIARLEEKFKIKINQKNINNFGSVKSIIKELKILIKK